MGRRETKILFDFVSRALRRPGPSLKNIMECRRGVTRNKTDFNPWFRCLSLVVNSELLVLRRKSDPTVNLRPEDRNNNRWFKIETDHISIAIPQSGGQNSGLFARALSEVPGKSHSFPRSIMTPVKIRTTLKMPSLRQRTSG